MANPQRRATRPRADESLEVEASIGWQLELARVSAVEANGMGARPDDESGTAAGGEKPLNGDERNKKKREEKRERRKEKGEKKRRKSREKKV